ncbi:Uncharacterised protein [Vibrio cholerae]|nr:Uncharacterised protein [Vibrio cholerae]
MPFTNQITDHDKQGAEKWAVTSIDGRAHASDDGAASCKFTVEV